MHRGLSIVTGGWGTVLYPPPPPTTNRQPAATPVPIRRSYFTFRMLKNLQSSKYHYNYDNTTHKKMAILLPSNSYSLPVIIQ